MGRPAESRAPRARRRAASAGHPALTRSQQDYLKALYALAPDGAVVGTSRIAERLALSAPSVTHMLARLAAEGLVAYTPRGGARLTPLGRTQALRMVRRHRILETFLVRVLGLDWSEVHDDAEILEHHISDPVLDAIDRLCGHPVEDPHGHPIPDAAGHIRARRLTPLAALPRGARATVREIRDAERSRLLRFKELGLVPGARVRVAAVRPVDDLLEIEVAGRRHVLGRAGLEEVLVQTGGAAARR